MQDVDVSLVTYCPRQSPWHPTSLRRPFVPDSRKMHIIKILRSISKIHTLMIWCSACPRVTRRWVLQHPALLQGHWGEPGWHKNPICSFLFMMIGALDDEDDNRMLQKAQRTQDLNVLIKVTDLCHITSWWKFNFSFIISTKLQLQNLDKIKLKISTKLQPSCIIGASSGAQLLQSDH